MTKEVTTNQKYWLIRTFGGKYYNHFVQNNYIAIGWNELSDIEMIKKADKDSTVKEELFGKAKEVYSKKEDDQMGRIVNPIIKFVNDMNIGDVVVIPSVNSKEIHFGIIKSDVRIVKDVINLDEGLEPLYKQRTVEWVTWRDKDSVDLNIFKMLSSHYAISAADDYSESIDRTMYSFYVKGDMAHLVIKVGKKGEYTGTEIPDLINLFLGTIDLYNEVSGSAVSKSDVKMKISLQSDGFVLFSGYEGTITVILAMAVALCGGGFKLKRSKVKKDVNSETGVEVDTSGLIPTIWDRILTTKDQKHRHKLEENEQKFRQMVEALNVALPPVGEFDENYGNQNSPGE